jgi:Zn-dependent peptidase ImmA (M78 family)
MASKFKLVDEKLRLDMKSKADEVRYKWTKKGLTDIFSILDNIAILIRRPIKTNKFSGFSTYFENNFIVFLNSSYTLGHERFSGAHELYHIIYNDDILKKNQILFDDERDLEDKANIFAAEFLMPEEGIKEVFYKQVDTKPNQVDVKHIVRMHNYFKVSFKAMLKQLTQLGLCDEKLYSHLLTYQAIDKADELIKITKQEGYLPDLIIPSMTKSISTEYLEIIRNNYEIGKISYGKLKELLGFIGKVPEDYGYVRDEEY